MDATTPPALSGTRQRDRLMDLTISNIRKDFAGVAALHNVSLKVDTGELIALLGPSGSGKTTLLRLIAGLDFPTGGQIRFGDQDASLKSVQERNVGFVFQHFNLIKRLTVKENVMFGPVLSGMDPGEAEANALEALGKVGLLSSADSLPDELSGGQQQRVGIARALALNPEIMLLDEPTASLDPILVGEVLDVMEDLARNTKATMIIVTHEVSFALKVAHRIILMDHGKIVEEGTPAEIFSQPQSEIGRKYKRLLMS